MRDRVRNAVITAYQNRGPQSSLPIHCPDLSPGQIKRGVLALIPHAKVGVRRGVVSLKLADTDTKVGVRQLLADDRAAWISGRS